MKRIIVVIMLVLLTTFVSCKESVPTLPYEPNSETSIPVHYETHRIEGLFSISCPPDWEADHSIIEASEALVKEWAEAEGINEVQDVKALFFAGIPHDQTYNPSVNVVCEPLPRNTETIDELAESTVRGMKEAYQDYEDISIVKTTIDNREAAIFQFKGKIMGVWFHSIAMAIMEDKIIWGVTCGLVPSSADFSDYEEDFYSIVRSFRLLD